MGAELHQDTEHLGSAKPDDVWKANRQDIEGVA